MIHRDLAGLVARTRGCRSADFATVWNELFPAKQARILQLLMARVKVRLDGLEISLRVEGIDSLVEELRLREAAEQRAA
jgi:site-specific DNA recombinase